MNKDGLIFDLDESGNVIIRPEALLVPEFEKLWKDDRTKGKSKAFTAFKYMFLFAHDGSKNPYDNYPYDKKVELIGEECYNDSSYEPSEKLGLAIRKYKEMFNEMQPTKRLVKSVKNTMHGLAEFLDKTQIDEDSLDGIIKVLDKTGKIVETLSKVEEAAKKSGDGSRNRETALFEL